jgi:hypothetical protein
LSDYRTIELSDYRTVGPSDYRLDKYWENEELYYSDYRAEISGGNRSDIQLADIDTNGESGEVAPRGTSSGNHR